MVAIFGKLDLASVIIRKLILLRGVEERRSFFALFVSIAAGRVFELLVADLGGEILDILMDVLEGRLDAPDGGRVVEKRGVEGGCGGSGGDGFDFERQFYFISEILFGR